MTLPEHLRTGFRLPASLLLAAGLMVAACSTQEKVILVEDTKYFEGAMPADFSGSWARDYARGDDINVVLQKSMWALARRRDASTVPRTSDYDRRMLVPIARLAEGRREALLDAVASVAEREFGGTVERTMVTPVYLGRRG